MRYFRSISALWNLNNVAGFTIAQKLWDTARTHKERDQSEHKAIYGGWAWGTLSGSIADDKLLLEQQGFRGDGAHAVGEEEFRQRDEKVDSSR